MSDAEFGEDERARRETAQENRGAVVPGSGRDISAEMENLKKTRKVITAEIGWWGLPEDEASVVVQSALRRLMAEMKAAGAKNASIFSYGYGPIPDSGLGSDPET